MTLPDDAIQNEIKVYLHALSLEIAAWKGDWEPKTHILHLTQQIIDLVHKYEPGLIDPESKKVEEDAGWRGYLWGYRIKVMEHIPNHTRHRFERVHERRSKARTSGNSQANIA